MGVMTEYISVSTKGRRDVIDITPVMQDIIKDSNINSGIAVVFVPGSTCAVTTIEYEPGLKRDINEFLERLLPYAVDYHHHNTWHDDNGAAHLQAALIGPSITVPVVEGKLALGAWQQVVLIDCDTRPRKRRIVLQIVS
jgi:secondary thiamine-phosphate synthase enzyme